MLLSQPLNHSGLNSPAAVASQVYAQYTFSIIEYGLYQFLQYTLRAPPRVSMVSRSRTYLLRSKPLSDKEGSLSVLKSIERWVGRYPLSTTTYCPSGHLIYGNRPYCRRYSFYIVVDGDLENPGAITHQFPSI